MLRFIILVTFSLVCLAQGSDDFLTFNYCLLERRPKCKRHAHPDEGGHPACNCSALPGRREVVTGDSELFRQAVLDIHNDYRNFIATGAESERNAPEAADMMVLNWDIELEYLAKCRLLHSFSSSKGVHMNEPCTYTSKGEHYGQNTFGQEGVNVSVALFRKGFALWTDQIKDIDSHTIDSFGVSSSGQPVKRFTQVVWSSITHLGCALVENDYPLIPKARSVVVCNYKSILVPYGGNLVNNPVYIRGKSCTACPYDIECESPQYPALCGKAYTVDEAPDNEPVVDYEQGAHEKCVHEKSALEKHTHEKDSAGKHVVQQMDEEGGIEIVRGPIGVCTSKRNVHDWVLGAACLLVGKLVLYVF